MVEELRQYPASLLESLAALEHDQFVSHAQVYWSEFSQEARDKWESQMVPYVFAPEPCRRSARAWAKASIVVFETGEMPDLRRKG